MRRGGRDDRRRPRDVKPVPAFAVEVVDTTGCGDAFSAGFFRGLSLGRSRRDAAVLGCAAAALVAGAWAPTTASSTSRRRTRSPPPRPDVAAVGNIRETGPSGDAPRVHFAVTCAVGRGLPASRGRATRGAPGALRALWAEPGETGPWLARPLPTPTRLDLGQQKTTGGNDVACPCVAFARQSSFVACRELLFAWLRRLASLSQPSERSYLTRGGRASRDSAICGGRKAAIGAFRLG